MKKSILLALLPLVFLLTGCPYNSSIPLSEMPKTPIDPALLGDWTDPKMAERDSSLLRIYAFNKFEYCIVIVDRQKAKAETEAYRAFLTPVNDRFLINMESLNNKGMFNFFGYTMEGNKLTLKMVSDVLLKDQYSNSKTLKKIMASKMSEKEFYESEMVLIKIK